MMTTDKAVKFLRFYDKPTLLRWFVELASFRWPKDLPFFVNPMPEAIVLDGRAQFEIVSDRTWISLFVALHELTTREERMQAIAEQESLDRIYSMLVGLEWEGMQIGIVHQERRA